MKSTYTLTGAVLLLLLFTIYVFASTIDEYEIYAIEAGCAEHHPKTNRFQFILPKD